MKLWKGGAFLSALLDNITTAMTGILGWFSAVLTGVETAVTGSFLLQLALALAAAYVGFDLIKKAVNVIRGFLRK